MRIKVSVLLLCVVVGALGFAPVESSNDRDCIIYSIDEEFKAAAAVFEARVTAVDWITGRECCHVLSGWATVQTERWWKGRPVKEVKLEAVGRIFSVGERYIIFGFGKPLVADGCNNTLAVCISVQCCLSWGSRAMPSSNLRASISGNSPSINTDICCFCICIESFDITTVLFIKQGINIFTNRFSRTKDA